MLNISFTIDPYLIPILIEQINGICSTFENTLAIDIKFPDDDPDISEYWQKSLLADLQYDCQNLLSLVNNETFGQEPISLEIDFAEAVSRACSAIRHKLKSDYLKTISNDDLESNNPNLTQIPNNLVQPYACFFFLASLQEAIVQGLEIG